MKLIEISVKNYADAIIFRTAICFGAKANSFDGRYKFDICIASFAINRSEMRISMEQVDISVIMPAYNCEQYIGRAIESVLAQDVSLELIIINDCSKDDTEEMNKKVREYLIEHSILTKRFAESFPNARLRVERFKKLHDERIRKEKSK